MREPRAGSPPGGLIVGVGFGFGLCEGLGLGEGEGEGFGLGLGLGDGDGDGAEVGVSSGEGSGEGDGDGSGGGGSTEDSPLSVYPVKDGSTKSCTGMPAVAEAMKSCHMSAGIEPPNTAG